MLHGFKQTLRPAPDLCTSIEIRGDRAIYEVCSRNPLYQERLLHMGFALAGRNRFTRNLSASGDVLQIHSNFALNLEEMLLQSARLHPVPWEETLALFLRRLKEHPCVGSSVGRALWRFVESKSNPAILDFCVNDANLAGRIFEHLLVEPVTAMTGWIAERGARAFGGCLFEWMAGVHPEVDEPTPHEQGLVALGCLELAHWRGDIVPVAPLALQLSVAERRGLRDRVEKIQSYLTSHG